MSLNRRNFLQQMSGLTAGLALAPEFLLAETAPKKMFFKISLAEWSLHKAIFGKKMTNLDFPLVAKRDYGLDTVEYVSTFFEDKQKDKNYLKELLKRSKDNGVKNHLMMVDGMGDLAAPDKKDRLQAVENHKQWVDASKYLGIKLMRVNVSGSGEPEDMKKVGAEGLSMLAEFAKTMKIDILVENHGGMSSDASWLTGVVKQANTKNTGILADFDNFCVMSESGIAADGKCANEYNRYKGMKEMMPYVKGLSAKTHYFNEKGECVETDFYKMLQIIKDGGYRGYISAEFEGPNLSEEEGIKKTIALLKKAGAQVS